MRAKFLLVGGLALLLGACSGKGGIAPPPLHKEWLIGKWKNESPANFITGYEFAEDGTMKMTVQHMEKPITARYSWSGDRTLALEYPTEADVQEAYKKAAKAYKDQITERIKTKDLPDKAGPSMIGAVSDELPAKETLKVAIAEQTKPEPLLLILTDEKNAAQNFKKVD